MVFATIMRHSTLAPQLPDNGTINILLGVVDMLKLMILQIRVVRSLLGLGVEEASGFSVSVYLKAEVIAISLKGSDHA